MTARLKPALKESALVFFVLKLCLVKTKTKTKQRKKLRLSL